MTKTIQLHTKPIANDTNHKVTKGDVMEAIEYFHTQGFIEDMLSDQKYYVEILLRKVANVYNIRLEDENGQLI